jgi:hypothetical protein
MLMILAAFLLLAAARPAAASAALRVYLAGESSTVRPALELAGADAFVFVFVFVADPGEADVLLLNGEIPDAEALHARLAEGAGLVLILGPQITSASFTDATGVPLGLAPTDEPVSLVDVPVADEPIRRQIVWNGAPQVRERDRVETPFSTVQPLVMGYEDGSWLIWRLQSPNAFIVDFYLGRDDNRQFREWAYYNYLIYNLVMRAGGRTPLDFAEYPGSPVPHETERNALLAAMALLIAVSFAAFFLVRRYSKRHPEALEAITLRAPVVSGRRGTGSAGAGSAAFREKNRRLGTDRVRAAAFRLPGGARPRVDLLHPPDSLPEPDPSDLHPALGPGDRNLGAGDPVFQRGLVLLRHGHQRRLH